MLGAGVDSMGVEVYPLLNFLNDGAEEGVLPLDSARVLPLDLERDLLRGCRCCDLGISGQPSSVSGFSLPGQSLGGYHYLLRSG